MNRRPPGSDRTRFLLAGLCMAVLGGVVYATGLSLFGIPLPLIVVIAMGAVILGGFWPMLLAGWGGMALALVWAALIGAEFTQVDVGRHIAVALGLPAFAVVGEFLRRNRTAARERQQQVDEAYTKLQMMYGQLEAALAEQHDRRAQLEAITTSVPGVIFQYVVHRDQRHGFGYLSPNVKAVFGIDPEALLQDATVAWRRIHREDRRAVRDQLMRAATTLSTWVQEFRIVDPAQPEDIRWITVHAKPFADRSAGTVVWTGLVSADDSRRELQDRLWKSQRLEGIGVLAGGIAHDFNNVLTAVIAEVDLLELDLADDPRVREPLAHIRTAAESGATLSRHLLGFAGRAVFAPRVIPIDHAVARAAPLLRRLLRERVQLSIDVPPGLGNVRIDPGLFDQVLMNLATNARDAMEGTGVLRISAVRHSHTRPDCFAALPPGDLIELVVADTGPGMPEAVRACAFDPFYTTKTAGRGSGLGLATSHGIIRQADGAIHIDPQRARGCTIRIALPVTSAPAAGIEEPAAAGTAMGSETLLVVDDEHQVRRVTTETLRRRGYTVLEAASGADAIRLARRHGASIDLLITDVVMPEMDGLQLAAALRREGLAHEVLYVSGYAAESMAMHGIDSSDIDLLAKPYRIDALAARVRARLDASRTV